ncbi:caspase domain-containing protein [Gymnopilus junonius]|uniref:Caspase domain-containing protein n=1 Tax=Gymnopilus junonius TaxID=109634 RepID=A0A9P5TF02_GYMJU|nr:caspase domain-containing protein [Gymnopilus junonius]
MTALIIGINTYKTDKSLQRLKGAVPDALAMRQYLKGNLRIPDSHIQMLLEEQATRKNIIDAFIALQKKRSINYGDAVLIYYAGHGQEIDAPEEWNKDNIKHKIQSIVPQDFDGENVHVIPDYTLGYLIYKISEKHGDNITVIFDCCHSGSGTRIKDPDRLDRTAYLENYSIPVDLDEDLSYHSVLGSSRSITPLSGPSLSTHILLAACSATERAGEMNGRGKFTRSLEAALKAVSPDHITYMELLDRLENIVGQNPQLEGNNRHRVLFNSKASSPTHYPHKIFLDGSATYILQAGAADGVCQGAQFTVYATFDDVFKKPLGTVIAETVKPFETIMRPVGPFTMDHLAKDTAYAVQTRAGEQAALNVYIPMTEDLKPGFSAHLLQQKDPGANQYSITQVQDRSIAQLELKRDGRNIRFLILEKSATVHGLTECIHKAPAIAQDLRPILQGAAHYYYHLNRPYPNSVIEKHVKIEFFKLENTGKYDLSVGQLGRPLRRPTGNNLIKNKLVSLDIADNDYTVYGLVITNTGKVNLYPNLFYFDNSELSIKCYYKSGGPSNFQVDCPLPVDPNKKLTVGFGDGGGTAFEYYIPEGRDVDVGFLRCFLSTAPVDLSRIEQDTPFQFSRALVKRQVKALDTWGCITIPVVQKRVKA